MLPQDSPLACSIVIGMVYHTVEKILRTGENTMWFGKSWIQHNLNEQWQWLSRFVDCNMLMWFHISHAVGHMYTHNLQHYFIVGTPKRSPEDEDINVDLPQTKVRVSVDLILILTPTPTLKQLTWDVMQWTMLKMMTCRSVNGFVCITEGKYILHDWLSSWSTKLTWPENCDL